MATVSQIHSTQEWAGLEPPSCSTHTSTGKVLLHMAAFWPKSCFLRYTTFDCDYIYLEKSIYIVFKTNYLHLFYTTDVECSKCWCVCFVHSTESVDLSKQGDASRIRSRIPPNMPKLVIPSTVTKFPPEITVTPPTPTLLSPKGSISEETKQKLKVGTQYSLFSIFPLCNTEQ